jgi:predicted RNA-binding Zn ribbon-like protein
VSRRSAGAERRPTDAKGRYLPDGSWPAGREAPAALEPLRRFLNTTNRENGAEHLDGPVGLRRWLAAEGHAPGARCQASDAVRVVALREALRALAAVSDGHAVSPDAQRVLRAEAERCIVRVALGPPEHLDPVAGGLDGFCTAMLTAAYDAMRDGSWARLKVCDNVHCGWAFYDHSRNGAGRWCSRAACGSRVKARAYRARQKSV